MYVALPFCIWLGKVPYSINADDHAGTNSDSQKKRGCQMKSGMLVAIMAIVTILLRFLPFMVFKKNTPKYSSYLGEVLPSAIIGMLVVYCLRNTDIIAAPHGLPELIAAAIVVGLQIWKRNALVSILSGTVAYMLMVQLIF